MNVKRFDAIAITAVLGLLIVSAIQGLNDKSFYVIFSFIISLVCIRGILIESTGFTTWMSPQLLYFIFALVANYIGVFDFWYRFDYSSRAPEIVKNIVILYNLHFILLYFGTAFYNRLKQIKMGELVDKYYRAPFENTESYRKLIVPSIVVFTICALFVWIVIFKGHYYPLENIRNLLSGNIELIKDFALKVRGEISFGELSGGAYAGQAYLNQVRIIIIPVIVIFWIILAYLTRDKRIVWLASIGFVIECIFLTGFFERGVLLIFFVRLFLLIPLLYRPQKISRRKLILFSIVSIFIVLLSLTFLSLILGRMTFTHNILADFSGQIFATLKRFYNVNSLATFYGFKVVPELLPYQNGQTWTNTIADYLPGRDAGWSSVIYSYGPWGAKGNATQSLFAEMWANGGAPVIAFGSFIVGFLLQSFNVWMANQKTKDIIRLIFFNIALFSISYTAVSNLFTGVDTGLLAAVVMLLIMQAIKLTIDKIQTKEITTTNQNQ